jgi:hypothetical protein
VPAPSNAAGFKKDMNYATKNSRDENFQFMFGWGFGNSGGGGGGGFFGYTPSVCQISRLMYISIRCQGNSSRNIIATPLHFLDEMILIRETRSFSHPAL